METLGQLRDRFTLSAARWVIRVNEEFGYTLRICEALRSDEQAEINAMGAAGRAELVAYLQPHFPVLAGKIKNNAGSGIRNSLHELGLAGDYQLFVGGRWISDGTVPEWRKVGELWESMGEDHAWGGRFGDSNHISIAFGGRK